VGEGPQDPAAAPESGPQEESRAPADVVAFGMAELLPGYVQSGHLAAYVFVYLTARRLLSLRACSHDCVKGHEGVAGTKLGLEPDGPPSV
jgi:hypothetical protein